MFSTVFMKNGQNGLQPILPIFQAVTIGTMLNKNGLKDVKCEQTFRSVKRKQ